MTNDRPVPRHDTHNPPPARQAAQQADRIDPARPRTQPAADDPGPTSGRNDTDRDSASLRRGDSAT